MLVRGIRSRQVCRSFNVRTIISKNLIELELKGFTVVENVFSPNEINQLKLDYEIVKNHAYDIMKKSPSKPRVWVENNVKTESVYWRTKNEMILQAGPGRYDLYKGFNLGIFNSETVSDNKVIKPLIDKLLVSDYLSYNGVILSEPGSEAQYWHRDTDNLTNIGSDGSKLVLLDDFYFTCLIPITVPLTLDNGATEFMVGSHRRGASKFDHLELARAEVPIGSALLFNGKANHRGGANNSSHERPVLYKVYHKRWYNDQFRKGVALQDQ